MDHPVTEQVARIYLNEAFADGFRSADVLLLGCTHYHLLKPLLRRVVPSGVALVDSAESMALAAFNLVTSGSSTVGRNRVARVAGLNNQLAGADRVRFFVTDSVDKFKRLGTLFLGHSVARIEHVDLKE